MLLGFVDTAALKIVSDIARTRPQSGFPYIEQLMPAFFQKGPAQQHPVFAFSGFRFEKRDLIMLAATTADASDRAIRLSSSSWMSLSKVQQPRQRKVQASGVLILPCW